MKKILAILFLFISFIVLPTFAENETEIQPSQTGKVLAVEYVESYSDGLELIKQYAEIKLNNSEQEIIYVENVLSGNPHYDINLKKNMQVILHVEKSENGLVYSVEGIKRSNILFLLSLIFSGLLIYVGRKKGVYSLVSIVLTCVLILNLLSPLILLGISPIFATILICLLSTALTMYLVGGFNRKSTSATIGCIGSILVAGLLSILTVKFANLTGFSNENSLYLYSAHPELNFIGILISTMLLATLGAVMDVAMSIASTINEIFTLDSSKTVKELFISGMNVGRDIIGTMANTLILVYLGGALPLVLLASNIDIVKFINLNQVVTEISAALIGSIAIIICVPITAIISANLIKNTPEEIPLNSMDI